MILLSFYILLLLLSAWRGKSIATYMVYLYILSDIGLLFLSPSHFFNSTLDVSGYLFLLSTLFIVILPWSSYKTNRQTEITINVAELRCYRIMKYVGLFCLLINLPVCMFLFHTIADFSSYKNGGETALLMHSLPVPYFIFSILSILSPLMILALPFHFRFLEKKYYKGAIISLLCAINYPLSGLIIFSRSRTITFIGIYLILFVFFSNSLSKSVYRRTKRVIVILLSVFALVLSAITLNRFSRDQEYVSESFMYPDHVFNNPTLNAQLSYLSQWKIYADKWIPKFNGNVIGGSLTFPVSAIIGSITGIGPKFPEHRDFMQFLMFQNDFGCFMGVSTDMLYDVGYIWTYLILIIIAIGVHYFQNAKKNKLSITNCMFIITLMLLPLGGIFSSAMNDVGFHYCFIICIIMHIFGRGSS